jgi:thioredoxin-like negative regulator of GroEL
MPTRTKQSDSGVQPNREELLQLGIRAAKEGNKDSARTIFQQVLQQDRRNERAMMWMAKLAGNNKAERRQWLEKVLDVNPDNEQARTALKSMTYQREAKENRTLLLFGVVLGVLVVLAVVVFLFLQTRGGA